MKPSRGGMFIPILLALEIAISVQAAAAAKGVTHEDIRDAMLSFVHMFRDVADKLDRHEYRERHLGELLKKMLTELDNRGRAHEQRFDTVSTTIARIDERLRRIENNLDKQVNNRERGTYTVDTMHDSIQSWMTNIENLIQNQSVILTNEHNRLEILENVVGSRLDNIVSSVTRLESFAQRPNPTTTVTDIVNYEGVLSKFEDKLSQLRSTSQDNWQELIKNKLETHEQILHELKDSTNSAIQAFSSLPNRFDLLQMINSTREDMDEVKTEIIRESNIGITKLTDKVDGLKTAMTQEQEMLFKAVTDSGVMAEGLYADVQKSYDQLSNEVKGLTKVEQVLIQTADNVLDTKRRIEYGVHQILLEVGDLVKLQGKDLNSTFNKRFDEISDTIVVNHNGGFNNLSSKIETEISQVWRQIGIMYQQLTASAGALDRLQQQTENYVNGSLHTMDSMEGKVGMITSRMSEVDENLNYLLGRLSLVTHEFGQIKTGLGTALDNIRSSFLSVQDKVKEVGPGPKRVDITDSETEDNKL